MRIDHVRRRLATHTPTRMAVADPEQAAVAVLLREGRESAEVLLIERAQREGDPWSGHMAFPGGRLAAADGSTLDAARRETLEEVGLDLAGAEILGQLDDLMGNPRLSPKLVIAAHAFHVEPEARLVLDAREVQDALWIPLAHLLDEEHHVAHVIAELPDLRFPGIRVSQSPGHVVWGLTYRFLDRMLALLGHSLPDRWGDLSRFGDP